MYPLISGPLQQAIGGIQAQICSLEEDMGESETCQVGGSEGCIIPDTIPEITFNLRQLLPFQPKNLVMSYSAGVACFSAGIFSTKLSMPEESLASKDTAADVTCAK